jgi:hypothetical protein
LIPLLLLVGVVLFALVLIRVGIRDISGHEGKCVHGMRIDRYCIACDKRRPRYFH